MNTYFTIGQAASYLKITVEAIRFYEKEGIIPPFYRDANNYRMVSLTDLLYLKGVIQLRQAGFSLEQIKKMNKEPFSNTPDMQMHFIHQGLDYVKQSIHTLEKIQADLTENLKQLKDFYDLQSKGCHVSIIPELLPRSKLLNMKDLLSDEDVILPLTKENAQGNLFLLRAFTYKEEKEIDRMIEHMLTYCTENKLTPKHAVFLKVLAKCSYYSGDKLAVVLYLNLEEEHEYTTRF
jgi:MerR family mercuric resistance operon transcriptional regulator